MTQQSFTDPVDRAKEVLKRASEQHTPETILLAVSGGTDSVVAADIMARYGPEFGLEPDAVVHINTGARIPQSTLVARTLADIHDLDFIMQGYRNKSDSLAERILDNGWPGGYAGSPMTGGHGLEWANRKDKPMNEVYMMFEDLEMWGSGARKLESKKRQGNVPDSGIYQDKPRRVWVSPISGWTSAEKKEYIKDKGLPVSEAYLVLGFSGECIACSFDERGLLTNIDILSPEMGYAIRTLAVWVYMRARRGDIDIDPKQLCWGWDPGEKEVDPHQTTLGDPDTQTMVGCDTESCSTREMPNWIRELPDKQIINRQDVLEYWETGKSPPRFPL